MHGKKKQKRNIIFNLQYQLKDFSSSKITMEETVDYEKITEQIAIFLKENSFELVESLVFQVVNLLKKNKNIEWIRVECVKPCALMNAESVSVVYTAGKQKN